MTHHHHTTPHHTTPFFIHTLANALQTAVVTVQHLLDNLLFYFGYDARQSQVEAMCGGDHHSQKFQRKTNTDQLVKIRSTFFEIILALFTRANPIKEKEVTSIINFLVQINPSDEISKLEILSVILKLLVDEHQSDVFTQHLMNPNKGLFFPLINMVGDISCRVQVSSRASEVNWQPTVLIWTVPEQSLFAKRCAWPKPPPCSNLGV